MAFIGGVGGGAWDSAESVWFIEMWQEKSAPILHFAQFAYGVGSILGPLLENSYLTGEPDDNNGTTSDTPPVSVEERRRLLMIPFSISGALQIIGKFIPFYTIIQIL